MFKSKTQNEVNGEKYIQKGILKKVLSSAAQPNISAKVSELTLKDLCISESCIEIKIELNFYFHTSLWCLKRFYKEV